MSPAEKLQTVEAHFIAIKALIDTATALLVSEDERILLAVMVTHHLVKEVDPKAAEQYQQCMKVLKGCMLSDGLEGTISDMEKPDA